MTQPLKVDVEDRYVAPTVLSEPRLDSGVMGEENFAPVLCVLSVTSLDDALEKHHRISGPRRT